MAGRGLAAQRLSRLAKQLRPETEPYYVRFPPPGFEREFPAAGWYWKPAGHDHVVFLAASEISAAIALQRLIDAELADV